MAKRNMHPNSLENLKKGGGFTTETARKNGQKGAAASSISKRRTKNVKQIAKAIAGLNVNAYTAKKLIQNGVDGDDTNHLTALVMGLYLRGESGDAKAARMILELLDQDPQLELKKQETAKDKTDTDITISFHPASERHEDEGVDE